MNVKEHYEKHLSGFYDWITGDIDKSSKEFRDFLIQNNIYPAGNKFALDLGAGNGIQSIALHELGFEVTAIDFSEHLLNRLKSNPKGKEIITELADIRNVNAYKEVNPELAVCCGDTITHLEDKDQIRKFIEDTVKVLSPNGKLILSFRDYSNELKDIDRFIPVKSSDDRILTCILEYGPEKVRVTDLLHEKTGNRWIQKISSYYKVRISPDEITGNIESNGMKIIFNEPVNRMITVIAEKLQ
ncbi:MAG TPA: class I SAM-dependent methyltransferase [Ignavibacteria bacterium]|nr:class I SAM-dependent methyltransferase [Ignavibacteria bacterium]HMR39396.1 class I SAM-dependent methyltransferase [Ignavibacteria bacterium]